MRRCRPAGRRLSRFSGALAACAAALVPSGTLRAQEAVDIVAYFRRAEAARGAGIARKTRVVDVRPARAGEIVVTIIKGEGKETQSPPAKAGDMVVRNRCPETGNEEILVSAAAFARRYEGPIAAGDAAGWAPYRPRGVEMRFVTVAEDEKPFTFVAPWGENMGARPGDVIVQDMENPKDAWRVAKAAFACAYEALQPRGGSYPTGPKIASKFRRSA